MVDMPRWVYFIKIYGVILLAISNTGGTYQVSTLPCRTFAVLNLFYTAKITFIPLKFDKMPIMHNAHIRLKPLYPRSTI